jgi:sterol desaturase/sphingolipid hydroxylase (fatty acid hydroxylase superfamily)
MKAIQARVLYPAILALAVLGFSLLLAMGAPSAAASYLPVLLVGVTILVLERYFPEKLLWRPRSDEVRADAAFLALVQVALPRVLLLMTVLLLSEWTHEDAPARMWPHAWPLAAQTVAMVLLVDFFRYWLHRACHRFRVLWRLHEVHHSPEILYVLNVGRFHPLEKALHFAVDTVPFVLMGVSPQVIAGYFLLYSVNGFFQHSNLKLRYGWLNYMVGSAETHRWHHARDPRIAACNFSNTTIIWDLVFGTWYLPADETVGDIGVMDPNYPRGFLRQMMAPFRRSTAGAPSLKNWLADTALALKLGAVSAMQGARLARLTRDPMRAQRKVLMDIVIANARTTFGRQHDFASICGYEEFVRSVSVSSFEQLRPYVAAEIEREEAALTAEKPLCYVRTSGTTDKPKDLPMTASHLKSLRRVQETAIAFQHRHCPEAFSGGMLTIVSPPMEGVLANGRSFGSASGIVALSTPRVVRDKFVVPPVVLTIKDSQLKYLLILRLALSRSDLTYIATANPATVLTLMRLYRQHHTMLIEDVRRGGFFRGAELPVDVALTVARQLEPNTPRAADLVRLHESCMEVRVSDLWPRLSLVGTWTFGSSSVAVNALRRELPSRTRIIDIGYIASEFRGTITLGRRSGTGIPTLDTHFFEFVERDRWDGAEPEFLTLDRLRKGRDYYVIVTTPSGLYRYFMNDLVRVVGHLHRTPLLRFLQKGKGVTSLTGEKLYESQVLTAVHAALDQYGVSAVFAMMLADEAERRYALYLEPEGEARPDRIAVAAAVDRKLASLNVEYQAKRESQRLDGVIVHWLRRHAGEAYKQHCVQHGQREGQFKIVALGYRKDFGFDLDGLEERSES